MTSTLRTGRSSAKRGKAKSAMKRFKLGPGRRVEGEREAKEVRRRAKRLRGDSPGRGGNVKRVVAKHTSMRDPSTQKIYDLQSKIYDKTFGRLVRTRIGKAIVEQVDLQQGQIALDVGIGTGGSLEFWPSDKGHVVGVDLSGGMLNKAAVKIDETSRDNCDLARANALKLPFADAAFDHVFVSHVISVVSDPPAVLRECLRVAKPGAKVVMVNHFQSENKLVGTLEKLVCPICTKLGWKSDLSLDKLLKDVGVTATHRYKLTTPDLWETVIVEKPVE